MASDLRLGAYEHMGVRFTEIAGRSGTDAATGAATSERKFKCWGTTDIQLARAAILDPASPAPWDIYVYDGIQIEDLAHEWVGDGWEFSAKYNAIIPEVGGYTISIDTGGGTFRQTSAYATKKFAATGETAPDFGNAIDVQEGTINGTDRILPALRINARAKIAREFVPSPMLYSMLLARMTGRTNKTPFLDCDPGELLFAGASGEVVSTDPMLSFAFIYSPNLTGLTIGNIENIEKKGHEHLWFVFKSSRDAASNLGVKIPRAAYVQQIFGDAEFSEMKIGEPPTT